MSANILNKRHIDALVTAALAYAPSRQISWFFNGEVKKITRQTASEVGQILIDENYRSINYRYQENRKADRYTFEPFEATRDNPICLDAAQVFSALDCYEYQSSETPDFYESEAYEICRAIRKAEGTKLKGYEEAAWEIY